jgi:hypothetical protein
MESKSIECNYQVHSKGILGLCYNRNLNLLGTGSFDGDLKLTKLNLDRKAQLQSMKIKELKQILEAKVTNYSPIFNR